MTAKEENPQRLSSAERVALAPLAQLVEQLTLNQWVLGSSPRRRTMARWSSGQDGGLSRRKREFDSPTGHHSSFAQLHIDFNRETG